MTLFTFTYVVYTITSVDSDWYSCSEQQWQAQDQAHNTAVFPPWHAVFLHVFEIALAGCGWEEPLPYWDWSFDSQSPEDSEIWSPRWCVSIIPSSQCMRPDNFVFSGSEETETGGVSAVVSWPINKHDSQVLTASTVLGVSRLRRTLPMVMP